MTPEQRLLIMLISQSHISWDSISIDKIAKWIGAARWLDKSIDLEFLWRDRSYLTYCLGCGTSLTHLNSYPVILTRCPDCVVNSPLKDRWHRHLYPGEAKLLYIDEAISFPDSWTRDYYIHDTLARPPAL